MQKRIGSYALVSALAVAGGCASSPAVDPQASITLAPGQGLATSISRAPDGSVVDSLNVAPAALLPALQKAYTDLGLSVDLYNPTSGAVGSQSQKMLHRFAGRPLSKLVECGYLTGGDRADRWYVFVTLITQVTATPAGSVASTRMDAYTQDPSGGNLKIPCSTTGALEAQILTAARGAVASK